MTPGPLDSCKTFLRNCSTVRWQGRVTQVVGNLVESTGPFCSVGECCEIQDSTGSTFPGNPALKPHPANYTVISGDTVYSVACGFGNADPNQIIYANSLKAPSYPLTVGTTIYIP